MASITNRGAIFLVGFLFARLLEPNQFGEYVVIRSLAQVLEVSLGVGLGVAAMRVISNSEYSSVDLSRKIFTIFCVFIFSYVAFLVLYPVFYSFFPNFQYVENSVLHVFALVYSFFGAGVQVLYGFMKGKGLYKTIAYICIVSSPLLVVISFFSVKFFGVVGALYSLLFYVFFQFFSLVFFVSKLNIFSDINRKFFMFDCKESNENVAPLFLSALIISFSIFFLNMVLSWDSKYQVAYFNVGYLFYALLMFFPGVISDVVFNWMNSSVLNKRVFVRKLLVSICVVVFGVLPFSTVGYFYSDSIAGLVGVGYDDSAFVIKMFSICSIYASLIPIVSRVLVLYEKSRVNLYSSLIWSLSSLLFYFVFLGYFPGSISMVYAFSVAFFCQVVFLFIFLFKCLYD